MFQEKSLVQIERWKKSIRRYLFMMSNPYLFVVMLKLEGGRWFKINLKVVRIKKTIRKNGPSLNLQDIH